MIGSHLNSLIKLIVVKHFLDFFRSSFPGILQWFPVTQPPHVFELCPLEVAIESMQKANEDLKTLVNEHKSGDPPLNPLSMKLNGIIGKLIKL